MQQAANNVKIENLAETIKIEANKVFHKIPILGYVVWLMNQQQNGRCSFVGDLEWRVMPPLVLDQAKLYTKDESPLAFVSWALLSEEAAARYKTYPHKLLPSDWKSGDQVWLVDMLAPFGGAKDVLQDLKNNVFQNKKIFQLAPMQNKEAEVYEW